MIGERGRAQGITPTSISPSTTKPNAVSVGADQRTRRSRRRQACSDSSRSFARSSKCEASIGCFQRNQSPPAAHPAETISPQPGPSITAVCAKKRVAKTSIAKSIGPRWPRLERPSTPGITYLPHKTPCCQRLSPSPPSLADATLALLVPGTGLEPAHLTARASKTLVSAIPPPGPGLGFPEIAGLPGAQARPKVNRSRALRVVSAACRGPSAQ